MSSPGSGPLKQQDNRPCPHPGFGSQFVAGSQRLHRPQISCLAARPKRQKVKGQDGRLRVKGTSAPVGNEAGFFCGSRVQVCRTFWVSAPVPLLHQLELMSRCWRSRRRLLAFQTVPTGDGCSSRASAQVRPGKAIQRRGGSRRSPQRSQACRRKWKLTHQDLGLSA